MDWVSTKQPLYSDLFRGSLSLFQRRKKTQHGTSRSRTGEWEETVHADTGMLGLTTRHIYFAGSSPEPATMG